MSHSGAMCFDGYFTSNCTTVKLVLTASCYEVQVFSSYREPRCFHLAAERSDPKLSKFIGVCEIVFSGSVNSLSREPPQTHQPFFTNFQYKAFIILVVIFIYMKKVDLQRIVCNGEQLLSFRSFVFRFLLETRTLKTLIFLLHNSVKSNPFICNNYRETASGINMTINITLQMTTTL